MRSSRVQVLALAGVLLALASWLAAPALSLRPYQPTPIDFELRDEPRRAASVARATVGGSHVNVWRSTVIVAPKRFNLVGFRWRGARSGSLVVRVRRTGGRWSRWAQTTVDTDHAPDRGSDESRLADVYSDPVWAGEADELQYRIAAARPVRDIRLHFVNAKGTATAVDRMRTGLRRAVSGTIASVASVFGASAEADTSQPPIVTREQWGASSCPPRTAPSYGEVKLAFVHHTVTANDYGPKESAAMVLGICRYHRNSNRWNDIGYQFLVDKYGTIFEGRAGGIDQAVVGAQAQGYNSQSTGIASLGTFSNAGQSEEGLAALTRLLSWKLALHGVNPRSKVLVRSGDGPLNRYPAGAEIELDAISGHRDGDATSCPGDGLYGQLPRLRTMVTPDARTGTRLGLETVRARIPYGRKARLSGTLVTADGSPLAAQGVRIRAITPVGSSRTVAQLSTGPAGGFAINLRLVFNRTLRAEFGGGPALRPVQSGRLKIGVRPRVGATLGAGTPGRVQPGRRVVVNGSVQPRKRAALLIVDRRTARGAWRRIAKQTVRVRRGRIRALHRFRSAGAYRLRLGVDADGRNLSARSEPLELKVE